MGLFRRRPDLAELQTLAAAALAESARMATDPSRRLLWRLPLRWRLTFYLVSTTMVLGGGGLGAMFLFYTLKIPDPLAHRQAERAPIVRILARDGSVLAERGVSTAYVPLQLIPRRVTDAVLATEDRRFWDHWGVDPVGLLRALLANVRAGRVAQGGSTVTQQLAKNLFLSPDRTVSRKAEEIALAFWLELKLSKSEILELYLNRVYFGGGAYGIEAASQRFFDKSVAELSLAEAAVIAGLLKAPSKYAPSANPEQAIGRGRSVLASMRDAGFITTLDEQEAGIEKVRFAEERRAVEKAGVGYAVDTVLEELPRLSQSEASEIIVETTIESGLQRRLGSIIAREMDKEAASLPDSQCAAIVLDKEGAIRAIAGGRSYLESQFNRATKAKRQPGSAFKPFVYLAALEKGLRPDSIVYDLPVDVSGWAPRNDNGKYQGAIPLRQALAQSINTVAVRLLLDTGASRVASVARRLGVSSELRQDASLALGTSEVTMLELAGAYATFANGGHALEPFIIRRVRLGSGRILFTREPPPASQLVAPRDVAAMNEMLAGAITDGTGRRARLEGRPAAGKTGTSQDFRDAWFVGYTSDIVAAVWVGNDDGRPATRIMGGGLPATIWHEIMTVAHEGKPASPLPGVERSPPMAQARPSGATAEAAPVRKLETPRREAPAFPQEQIDQDFLIRALDGGTLEAKDRDLGALTAREAGEAPLIVRPTEGRMTLGGPPAP